MLCPPCYHFFSCCTGYCNAFSFLKCIRYEVMKNTPVLKVLNGCYNNCDSFLNSAHSITDWTSLFKLHYYSTYIWSNPLEKKEFQLQTISYLLWRDSESVCAKIFFVGCRETPACIIRHWRETAEENKEMERIPKDRL